MAGLWFADNQAMNVQVPTVGGLAPVDSSVYSLMLEAGGHQYACFVVDPKTEAFGIDFLWKNAQGAVLGSYKNALAHMASKKKKSPVFLMNAGIFGTDAAPMGLYCADGQKLRDYNGDKGTGNFFLDPAGVFIIEQNDTAKIQTRQDFEQHLSDTVKIKHATQSGPMLVIDGHIHPVFNPASTHLHIRNGVGITPAGHLVFIMSQDLVSLYDFASVFKDKFHCKNALYLDGAISKMYCPALNMTDMDGAFSGIIAVYPK